MNMPHYYRYRPVTPENNNNENLIICFGGMALSMGGILPFEFFKFFNKRYNTSWSN